MRIKPQDLETIGEYVQVDYSDPVLNFGVSDRPLVSMDYSFCKGIAIMNHTIAGLAHVVPCQTYSLTKLSAQEHIDAMLLEMGKNSKTARAVIIGRDRSDLWLLREACSDMGVEVSDEYRDPILRKAARDVIVLPPIREVWVYSEARKDKVVKRF